MSPLTISKVIKLSSLDISFVLIDIGNVASMIPFAITSFPAASVIFISIFIFFL